MNGVHDAGGMECYGPVVREEDEPVFHAEWERRVFGLAVSLRGALGGIDAKRHAIERMNPADYLALSYYERWLARTELRAKETGVLSEEELRTGNASERGRSTQPPLPPGAVSAALRKGSPATREPERPEPRFKVGETVTARNMNPRGHTRLPGYIRGKQGTIERIHGTHVYPDTNAHGLGENPQTLYSVCFHASTLWGRSGAANDRVYIDLWEDHLQAVSTEHEPRP